MNKLAAAVGTVAVRRNEQRHMVMRPFIGNAEIYDDNIQKSRIGQLNAAIAEIMADPELKPVSPGPHGFAFKQRRIAAPVIIGCRLRYQRSPGIVKADRYAVRRASMRRIEDMCCQLAHFHRFLYSQICSEGYRD